MDLFAHSFINKCIILAVYGDYLMKKSTLLISSLALLALPAVSCGQSSNSPISLYDADSRFVLTSFDEKGSMALPTYRNKNTGEVPYAELGEFFYANGALGNLRTNVRKIDTTYQVERNDGKVLMSVDPVNDVLTVENYQLWLGHTSKLNNGIGPDIASPAADDEDLGAVHGSKKTRFIDLKNTPKEIYNLKDYGFDFVEKDGKCYGPTPLLSTLFYRDFPTDLLYNGMDFYVSAMVQNPNLMPIQYSFYATNKKFLALEGSEASSYEPIGEEAYRFAYKLSQDGQPFYDIISLTKDGKGKLLYGQTPSDKGDIATINDMTFTYNWQKKENYLLVEIIASGTNPETGLPASLSQGTMKIPLRDTLFNTKTRSEEYARFSYDLLRFQFDKFYGLKDVAGFTSFEDYAVSKNLKQGLLSLDSSVYDEALAELTMKDIDDGHTSYTLPSIFSGKTAEDGKKLAAKHVGPRYMGLMNKLKEYTALRAQTMKLTDKSPAYEALGLFMEGSTAVIRFDEFVGRGTMVSNSIDKEEIESDPKLCFRDKDVPLGFDASFARIKKNNAIKNVVIDLSCNSGGEVMVIPYILAHITNDPLIAYNDIAVGGVKEFHYTVDLNHDKVYGGEGDTYQGQYKFYVLTSNFSFSCANMLPTFARYSGAKLIGEKGGGGACSVAAFSDGAGSFFNISSPMQSVAPNSKDYKHNDGGNEVDYPLASSSWYDLAKLDEFVSAIK